MTSDVAHDVISLNVTKEARAQALASLNNAGKVLLPGVLVADTAVLECLTAQEDLLKVLLTVCPVLLVVYAVAACAL